MTSSTLTPLRKQQQVTPDMKGWQKMNDLEFTMRRLILREQKKNGQSMEITEITEDKLPFFNIEIQMDDQSWNQWCCTPFATEQEALEHREKILKQWSHFAPDRVRVGPYTIEHWRQDLVNLVMQDRAITKSAVEQLSSQTMLALLRQNA